VLLLREQNRTEITAGLGRAAANGHRVLESLFDRPIISVSEAQQLTGTGFAAANQLIARMTELRILREITGHARNRRFRYEPYVRLFTDDAVADPA
jgi:Fic family protein